MTDDASTAYICIYCPFNSDNLEALENHLTSAHEYGCQDAPLPQSSSNTISKANKREAPEDEQSQSSFDGIERTAEHPSSVKRVKRASSPLSPNLDINSNDDNSEYDEDDDDERDSSLNSTTILSNTILTCPICASTYHRLGHLIRHAKRKHHIDLSNYNGPYTFDMLTALTNQLPISDIEKPNSNEQMDINKSEEQQTEILPLPSSISETNTSATTDCPYCDFKTIDIEQFKSHIIAHIRDKNYRCLLCNRLYKYRGDCSFHIRRKHHRYSANSNDYIQRFLFDTSDGDESMLTQSGGHGSSGNGSVNNSTSTREQDEPVRYFGCPYCDYTSNYGGDVRKHQARKHPNAESKVVKIIRQDSEQQNLSSNLNGFEEDDEDDSNHQPHINLPNKIKSIKKIEKTFLPQPPTTLPVLSNFAPVRVFQCSSCHQQGTYKWVVERHIRAKHPEQADVHVIELPAELSVKLQKITSPLKRFRCSLCPLQSKHSWVVIRHIKHFHTLQTASVLDIQPDAKPSTDESFPLQNGDFSTKSYNQDSESSSVSSSYIENGADIVHEDDNIHSSSLINNNIFIYKCSLCDYQSNISWNIQKHINEKHSEQTNAYMLTQQCQQTKSPSNGNNNNHHQQQQQQQKNNSIKKSKHKNLNGLNRSLSPTSALAKAKFSPAIEEALLSIQGSKLNPNLYAVQPKFGIKRLKCRHCFYRSNWKTDMIRHVRIRHNLTEPDHNKDMIIMSEQEARSTIELYENTFGKELRRRTFRTWNDWAKAEQEFTPKDGSLQFPNDINGGPTSYDHNISSTKTKTHLTTEQKSSSHHDEIKRSIKTNIKIESHQESEQKSRPPKAYNQSSSTSEKDDFKQLSNSTNIVSRLLLTTSPSHNNNNNNDDEIPLDLSFKPSTNNNYQLPKEIHPQIDRDELSDDEISDESSNVTYLCSVCPYKRSSWPLIQRHLSFHLTGQGIVCPICSYTTSSDNSMIRHMTINHPTSQITTKFQVSPQILTAHVIEQHQCTLCPYQCDRSETLTLHRRLEHDDEEFDIDSSDAEEEEDNLTISTTKNLFECPVCSPSSDTNNYTNLEQLTLHVSTNHNNQSCPFCSFIAHTTSSHTLTQHIKLHFNGTLVQPDPVIGIEQVKELLMLE